MRLVFVCDGNICRSPLAAEYMRSRADRLWPKMLFVDSVGLLGIEGAPAAPFSIQVGAETGLDLTGHRSRGITPSDVRIADVLIAMTTLQLEALARRFPSGCSKRLLVRAFEESATPRAGAPDLDDPINRPIEAYREAFAILKPSLDHLLTYLKHQR
jgi:protein-tyrosine-phosphatase